MCCFLASLSILGPRMAFLIYWLIPYGHVKTQMAFNGWLVPLLGLIFFPMTTLIYTLIFPLVGFDWIWLALAFLADVAAVGSGAVRRKDAGWYTGP